MRKYFSLLQSWQTIVFCIALGLFTYTSYRTANLSFTYDESSTVLEYVGRTYAYIFTRAPTATNHLLNSASAKFFSSIFPASEFVYRLPNLLAHLVYMLFSALLVSRLRTAENTFKIFGFVLLNFNPYLLDFFSLARGYGLAACFTMAAIYFLFRYHQSSNRSPLFACLISCSLAVLSNFTLLNFLLAISCFIFIDECFKTYNGRRFSSLVINAGFVLLTVFFLSLIIYSPIHELVSKNELFFGGETGIWQNTLLSVIQKSTYSDDQQKNSLAVLVFLVMLGLSWILALPQVTSRNNFGLKLLLLISIILFGLLAQNMLFGTRFIQERTALFLYPLFISTVIFSIHESTFLHSWVKNTMVGIFAFIMFSNTLASANRNHTLDWSHEADIKFLMHQIENEKRPYQTNFVVDWPYGVSCQFYRELLGYSWLKVVENPSSLPYRIPEEDKLSIDHVDVELVTDTSRPSIKTSIEKRLQFGNGLWLLTHRKPDVTEKVVARKWQSNNEFIDGEEYVTLYNTNLSEAWNTDSLLNFRVTLKLKPKCSSDLSEIWLVCEIDQQRIVVENCSSQKDTNGFHELNAFYRQSRSLHTGYLNIYLFNPQKAKLELTDFEFVSMNLKGFHQPPDQPN
ncbi:MAG: glycosyltransferase family 39 protein [Flavobacteriales bacterium]|nr:glycosyltransferase family 39 protein [Flavobacteriales bacterium]